MVIINKQVRADTVGKLLDMIGGLTHLAYRLCGDAQLEIRTSKEKVSV